MWSNDDAWAWMVGKTLQAIDVDHSGKWIAFKFVGKTLTFDAYGDCCSESWIEHVEIPETICGAVVTRIEDLKDDHEWRGSEDLLTIYQTQIHTTCGTIAIEYRNSSNGYYGGWLELRKPLPIDEDEPNRRRGVSTSSEFGVYGYYNAEKPIAVRGFECMTCGNTIFSNAAVFQPKVGDVVICVFCGQRHELVATTAVKNDDKNS